VHVYYGSIHKYNDSLCAEEMGVLVKTLHDSYIISDRYVTSVDIRVTPHVAGMHGGATNGVASWMGYAIRPK